MAKDLNKEDENEEPVHELDTRKRHKLIESERTEIIDVLKLMGKIIGAGKSMLDKPKHN